MASAVAMPATNGSSTDRRRSGRATHAPQIFSQEQHVGSVSDSAKRKRPAEAGNDEDDPDGDDEIDEDTSSEDGEPDEEELRERDRKQKSRQPVKKPAAKRPKTATSTSTTLAIRSVNAGKKPITKAAKQKARSRPSQIEAEGLYADVFGHSNDAETAAGTWHNKLEGDHVSGVTEIVNFVLQTIGCDARITNDDINDVDNVPDRLSDVLEQYTEQKEGDYALSGKQKQFYGMKEVFTEFFKAVLHALHNSGLLYEEPAIYDNLHVWIATMSGAAYRSFRVTATVASLAMTTAMTEIAKELRASIVTTKQQLDGEKKKKNVNKGRITKLQEEMTREEKKLEVVDNQLKDAFDTVYVHRYRDVEEKLRVECARAMGTWILNYRNMFLDGEYLRHLGWVMSDPHASTRLEVVKQLKAIYKVRQNLSALRGFTDRFRTRMVEMGARDADVTVRVQTLELLNMLRSAEMLEPDDIDTIGQLIFDNEPQVRQTVAHFFISNIEDLYNAAIEDFDKDEFDTALPDVDKVEDFDEPCKLWIRFKCLAQTLGAHTRELANATSKRYEISGVEHLDSRYMVATQAIFSSMPDLQEWESLAGYLIFDHSNIAAKGAKTLDTAVQEAYKLETGEEIILLDVLFCAAKLYILQPMDSKISKTKQAKDEFRKRQETAAHNLSAFIPKLHSKFGSIPRAAKSILRINQLFNPDLVDEIDDEEGEISALLDDINKQFTTHSDVEVLAEASRALRSALDRESSREAASRKVDELWRDLMTYNLSPLLVDQEDMGSRGTLARSETAQLADVVGRLAQLATVKDCCEVVEGKFKWVARKSTRKRNDVVFDIMLQLVKRGTADDDTPRDAAELEDQVCKSAVKVLMFYFRWKAVSLRAAVTANDSRQMTTDALAGLSSHKTEFVEMLGQVITSRKALDPVRIAALVSCLELYVLFATFRTLTSSIRSLDDDVRVNLESLVTEVNSTIMSAAMETHEKMEKRLGRKTNKRNLQFPLAKALKAAHNSRADAANGPTLNGHTQNDEEEVDRPPEDSDDEDTARKDDGESDVSSSEDGDILDSVAEEGVSAKDVKRKAALIAETSLCELTAKIVLAVLAGVVPNAKEVKARLQINRTKLGKSYTQVIAYGDDKKEKAKGKSKTAEPKTPMKEMAKSKNNLQKAPLSEAVALSDDDIEDDDERREDDDPEALREQGLDEDPVEHEEDDDANNDGEADVADDDDEIMGD